MGAAAEGTASDQVNRLALGHATRRHRHSHQHLVRGHPVLLRHERVGPSLTLDLRARPAALLLHDVCKLVRDQSAAGVARRPVSPSSEDHVAADRVRLGADVLRQVRRARVVMHPDHPQVGAKSWLEERPGGDVQRSTGRGQRTADTRRRRAATEAPGPARGAFTIRAGNATASAPRRNRRAHHIARGALRFALQRIVARSRLDADPAPAHGNRAWPAALAPGRRRVARSGGARRRRRRLRAPTQRAQSPHQPASPSTRLERLISDRHASVTGSSRTAPGR